MIGSTQAGFETTDVTLIHRLDQPCLVTTSGNEFWYRGHKLRHKPEGYTDGMSSPQFTHCIEGLEAYGWALAAADKHDGGYHDDLEMLTTSGDWVKLTLDKDECDRMLYELLLVLAGDNKQRKDLALVIYEAVHLAGESAFEAGRKK